LYKSIENLGSKIIAYDTGHPWLAYWSLHSLDILGALDESENDAKA
jgi:hypothetical protein